MNQTLSKIAAFFNRYRAAITIALFACVVAQQCTISTLRNELSFVKQKYEQPQLVAQQQSALENPQQSAAAQPTDIADTSTSLTKTLKKPVTYSAESNPADNPGAQPSNWSSIILAALLLLIVYMFVARRIGIFPYLLHAKGRIWQDLNGRVVYTLTIKNKSRKPVELTEAMIEFLGMRASRRFKVPTKDLPLTLARGTSHAIHIPLQKLLERDQQLLSFKAIRTSVTANGKPLRTLPLGVKWK